MWRLNYYRLAACAWVRGLFYRWPSQAPTPPGYTGVSCGLNGRDSRGMYQLGWEPWCFQWTRAYGVARLFRVKDAEPRPDPWAPTAQEWLEDMDEVPY